MATQKIPPFSVVAQITRTAINSMIGIINAGLTAFDDHEADANNPHRVTLAQVGGNNDDFLINSNFRKPINQNGLTTYNPTHTYTIDMWIGNDCTVAIGDGYIDVTGTGADAKLYTWLEDVNAVYGQRTFSFNVGSTIFAATGTNGILQSFTDFILTSGLFEDKAYAQISGFSGKTLRLYAAKLEVGDVSTLANSAPPNLALEILEC